MKHLPPSISQTALLLSPCIAWAAPDAEWYDDKYADTSKRDKGTNVHTVIDAAVCKRKIALDGFSMEELAIAYKAGEWWEDVLSPQCAQVCSETVVAIDWVNGKSEVLPSIKNRKYPVRDGWQFGTADLVCVLLDGSLYVGDWKTGGSDGAAEQLRSLAFGFLKAGYGSPELPIKLATLFVDKNGCWPHEETVTAAELEEHASSVRMQWEDIGKRNERVPGIHCTALYCNHLAYCPAIARTVGVLAFEDGARAGEGSGLIPAERLTMKLTDKPVDDFEAGETIQACSAADRQVKYYKAVMKEYVRNGGRVISGNFEWKDVGNGFRWYKIKLNRRFK